MSDDQFNYSDLKDREILILIAQKVHDQGEVNKDHEKRLSGLETMRTYATGFAAGLGILGFGWLTKLHVAVNNIASSVGIAPRHQ
jgi:hypothetical protein